MIIRTARPKDAEQINSLHIKLKKAETSFDRKILVGKEPRKFSLNWFRKNLKNKNIRLIVAEENKRIIGYALGQTQYCKSFGPYLLKKKICCITDLFILKKYREKGIGRTLAKELIKWFKSKKINLVEINTYSNNKTAIKFWKKLGFKELSKGFRKKV